jgi:hypothetical protein
MATTKVSALTAKTTPSGSEELLINDGGVSKKITIANLPDTDTTYSNFAGTTAGLVPTSTTGDDTKFLRADGTWVVPTDTDTTYSNFVGDDGAGGVTAAAGLVPAPTEGDAAAGKYLDSDGNWTVPPDTDTDTVYSLPEATATAKGGIELFSDTDQTVAANAVSATAARTYGVQLNAAGQGVVNVPWVDTDTDTVYTHPTGDGNKHVPANSTTNNGKYLQASATAGTYTWEAVDALPTQTGNAGKYLTTNATTASWATLDTDANSTTKGLYEHANTISADYTIATGNNAGTFGPISIDSGISVTIPSGSVWTIA